MDVLFSDLMQGTCRKYDVQIELMRVLGTNVALVRFSIAVSMSILRLAKILVTVTVLVTKHVRNWNFYEEKTSCKQN